RWRRVTIDDRIPVDAAGVPLLPVSEDPRELWPLLLAKALWKVCAASGVDCAAAGEAVAEGATGADPTAAEEAASDAANIGTDAAASSSDAGGVPAAVTAPASAPADAGVSAQLGDAERSVSTAEFAAFLTQCLTGWVPLSSGCSADGVGLSGAPHLAPELFLLPELSTAPAAMDAARERQELLLRKQARFLHKNRPQKPLTKTAVSAEEIAVIARARHGRMAEITAAIAKPRRRVSLLVAPNGRVLPLLAI
ncbi:unnamed protein product, partial [Phaeothamnion confervicola]